MLTRDDLNSIGTLFDKKLTPFDAQFFEINARLYKLEVLYEDLDHRFQAQDELLRGNFQVKAQVNDHETRLTSVESTQVLLTSTVKDHSRRLAPS